MTKSEIMRNIHIIRDKLDMIEQHLNTLERCDRKLTPWLTGKPDLVGEYETYWWDTPHVIHKRWWNGDCWSAPYLDIWQEHLKDHARLSKQPRSTDYIRYRGFTTRQE